MLVQFGDNWIQKIPLTAKLDSVCGLVQFWLSSKFFSSNYFQIGQHVVLLHILIYRKWPIIIINNRATTTRHDYSRWRRPGNLEVKISDYKIHFFQYKHFFEETCRPNLIQSIILFGLKLFISRSGGSL